MIKSVSTLGLCALAVTAAALGAPRTAAAEPIQLRIVLAAIGGRFRACCCSRPRRRGCSCCTPSPSASMACR